MPAQRVDAVRDGLDDARLLLPGVRLDQLDTLGGSDRSQVRRVHAVWPDGSEHALIVKTFLAAGEGWVRESAALSVLDGDAPAARLIADGPAPPTVVMSDAGAGASVADALLGDDPEVAADAVLRWAGAVAALHGSTRTARAEFKVALAARSGEVPVRESTMSSALDDAAHRLEDYCARLEIGVPAGALAELRGLSRRLDRNAVGALSPADACPDNNVRVGDDGLILVDFEGAEWRHVAWDVAYLTVPWPSCWCSWRMPAEVAERALERYRVTLEPALPYVRSPQFRADVTAAANGWSLISTAQFLAKALGDDPPPSDPAKRTPTRRAMILHRLDGARRSTELPAVAALAGELRTALVAHWGEVPLSFAPAFETIA